MREIFMATVKVKGLLLSAACIFMVAGCAYIEERNFSTPEPIGLSALKNANENPRKIRRILQSRRMAIDSLPVGSIVPVLAAHAVSIPENWRYCNGDVINDPESPLNGTRLPLLTDERFLMGSVTTLGSAGGENYLSEDGSHAHGGHTGPELTNAPSQSVRLGPDALRVVTQGHEHEIPPDGAHNHGGDRRPKWFGVLFVIKIK